MFRGLNARLLLSYVVIIVVCLALIGLGLLLFVRTSPLWTQAVSQQMKEAERATLRALLQQRRRQALTREMLLDLLTQAAEENDVRILLLDNRGKVRFDTQRTWLGHDLSQETLPRVPGSSNLEGTFIGPDGRRWTFVGNVFPPDGEQRQALILIFTAPPRRSLLFWFANNLLPPLARAGAVALVLSVLLALIIGRSIAAPLRRVSGAAEAIARGETSTRAPVSGPAEVEALARSFNTMANQVEATQRAQRDFVANVSHDLKTPLTSIQGFSQALLDGTASTPESAAHAAHVINDEAERMRRLVDDLLVLARFDAGQVEMRREKVNLELLLRGSVEKLTPQAQKANVTLVLDVPKRLFVTGDADRLAQVFTNLLDNAIVHTPAEAEVTVTAHSMAEEKGVEVTVTDTGEGIPAEVLPRIFERFYQVDKSRQHRRGTGLGLAIAKEVVEAHGGNIGVESVVGLGTKFTIQLPTR